MLSYAEGGDPSGPAVLMLPGPTDSWRSYQPILGLLPPDVRVIAVSQRGMVSPASPLRDTASRTLPPTWYRCSTPSTSSGLFWRAIRAHARRPESRSRSSRSSRRALLEASPTTLRDDARLLRFVESVVSELDDPISPEFARSFVVDTSSANVTPDLVDVLVEEHPRGPGARMEADVRRPPRVRRPDRAPTHRCVDAPGLGRCRRTGLPSDAGPTRRRDPRCRVPRLPRRRAHSPLGRPGALQQRPPDIRPPGSAQALALVIRLARSDPPRVTLPSAGAGRTSPRCGLARDSTAALP